MISVILQLLFTDILVYLFFYTDIIHLITGITGLSLYITYNYLYNLSFNNIYFAMAITPKNFVEPLHGAHKIISYGFSTIHSIFISLCASLYILQMIDNYYIKQMYFISMCYYFADIYYIVYSARKLTQIEYFAICHHFVMIMMYYVIFIEYNGIELENVLLNYMNIGLLAEYSVCSLNYSWYLVNTKQENTIKIFLSSIITLVLYFITRVLNFTYLIYSFWHDDLISALILMLPLFSINYYWFYKLICKAIKIYKKYVE